MMDSDDLLGHVRELIRYPVKSMGGESVPMTTVAPGRGLRGDRAWALRDLAAGEIRGAKKIPALLQCRARYLEEPDVERSSMLEIDLPAFGTVRSDDEKASARISERIGFELRLCPRKPAEEAAHYRRFTPITDMEAEIREGSLLLPEESLPDLGEVPTDLSIVTEYVTPPGTYFDFFDVHLLSRQSLDRLAALAPESVIDRLRFRPNLVVDLDHGPCAGKALPENELVGRRIAIGEAVFEVVMPMMRCVMTTHAQQGLPKDPSIMRTLVRECGMNLGVGLQVIAAGRLAVDDPLRILDA
jgi:hypothetical protein